MKKYLALILTLALALSLTSCRGKGSPSNGPDKSAAPAATQNANNAEKDDASSAGSGSVQNGDWPDNEFTKLIPKPTWTILSQNTLSYIFLATLSDATLEEVKAYVEELKTKGFTIDATTSDAGTTYAYQAEHANGYYVSVTFSGSNSGVSIQVDKL